MYCKLTSFLILGIKKSGYSTSKFLLERGATVYVYDKNYTKQVEDNINEIVSLGGVCVLDPYSILNDIDVLVLSPGVPVDNDVAIKARELNKRIIGEMELASYFITSPLVAVTGTNGKTTTTSMLSHVLNVNNYKNLLLGNIGTPLISSVNDFDKDTIGVLEVSSFQLETITRFTPHIACVLNLSPDHLDRHYNMENYSFLKSKLIMNLRESEFAVLNYDDDNVKEMASKTRGKVVWFSLKSKVAGGYVDNGVIYYNGEEICHITDIPINGLHNIYNSLCAVCVLKLLGLNSSQIKNGIKTFKGVKHRIEEIAEINGVKYYNDSKSTNPDSCLKAVESMKTPTLLIMGGYDKGFNYENLFSSLKTNPNIKKILLTGATSVNMFQTAIKAGAENVSVITDFTLAIKIAKDLSVDCKNVLFSPATSSFDLFSSYEERGDKFIEIVNSFK